MSEQTAMTVPAWTRGDRLRKARESAGLQQQQLADEIGVSRRSVSAYEGDDSAPKRPVLLSWAMRTRVPLAWLENGVAIPQNGPDGGATTHPKVNTLSLARAA